MAVPPGNIATPPLPNPTEEPPNNDFQAQLGLISEQIAEIRNSVKDLMKPVEIPVKPEIPVTTWDRFEKFFSGGLFFILLGIALLTAAYTKLGVVHSSFSFVLVVLGIAILLFGTGTQGIGKLESDAASAKYNVVIAGGAGVLAICIGFGMLKFAPQMQKTFAVETRQVIAVLMPSKDGSSNFSGYWAQFDIGGEPIPSRRRGNAIMVYIPYLATQMDSKILVSYQLLPQDPANLSPNLKPAVNNDFSVELAVDKMSTTDGAYNFPVYEDVQYVDMKSTSSSNNVLQSAGQQTQPNAAGTISPNVTEPAQLEVQ